MFRYPISVLILLFYLSSAISGFSEENTRFSIEGTVAYAAGELQEFIPIQSSFSCNWLFVDSALSDQLENDEYRDRYMRPFSDFYFSFDRHFIAAYSGELEPRKRSRIELENIPQEYGGDQIYMRIPLKSESIAGWSSVLVEMWIMDEEGILIDSPNLPRDLDELPSGAYRMHFVKNNDSEETATIEGELTSIEMVPAFLSDQELVSAMESYILELADHVKQLENELDQETSRNSLLEFKISRLNSEKEKLLVEVESNRDNEIREALEAKVVELEVEHQLIKKDQEKLQVKVVQLTEEKEERDESIKQLKLEKHALIQLIVDLKQGDKNVESESKEAVMRVVPSEERVEEIESLPVVSQAIDDSLVVSEFSDPVVVEENVAVEENVNKASPYKVKRSNSSLRKSLRFRGRRR